MRTMALISVFSIVSLTACGGQQRNLPPLSQMGVSNVSAPSFDGLPGTSTGTLYGTTQRGGNNEACKKARFDSIAGCGTVFALTPAGTERIVYAFKGGTDGRLPSGGLIADPSGTLYGTTFSGGGSPCIHGCGTVYSVTDSGSDRVLYAFRGNGDGREPIGRLLANTDGLLFGATRLGGRSHCRCGTIFELTPSGSGYTKSTIYNFQGGNDGAYPNGGLLADRNGTLYGTTIGGGQSTAVCTRGCGTAFTLTPARSGYTERILYRFQGGHDGEFPNELAKSRDGNFYGTTRNGGLSGCFLRCGTIFKLTRSGAHTVLFSFKGHNAGGYPTGTLLAGPAGTLYGTTERDNAGACCDPIVFRLASSGSSHIFTTLYTFNGSDLVDVVNGGLVAGPDGKLYGSTSNGGPPFSSGGQCFFNIGCGEIFVLTPQHRGYSETVIYAFGKSQQDGSVPNGDLLLL